ncbi:MAG: FlgD immunoglobulin-like domain containing protein [Ignavibacteria bacterium]|nr:FlgD immunoglobulin-like domain containing protein [Ignavibacteria bacterium]
MKKSVLLLLVTVFALNLNAQKAVLKTEAVSPHQLTTLGLTTNSVATGLRVVPNGTYVYLSPFNIPVTDPILTAVYTFDQTPVGSGATFTSFNNNWAYFKPDVVGEYKVKLTITTALGTDDTVYSYFAGNFVGVGNFDGVAGSFPKCMTCHASDPKFSAIYDRWKVSGHANIFKNQITTGAAYYSTSCMKCHTTGYDHNVVSSNGGFDDVATQLGWAWQAPPNAGKWDTLKTQFPGLVNLATIGCESCHGAGSVHATMGANKNNIQISVDDGVCAQCHDEPWRHNKVAEYENSLHSEAVYEGSATRALPAHDLQQCMRCHDGAGYVLYTKNQTTTIPIAPTVADHHVIGCATCHDPHGNDYTASLRQTPATGDTLGNGYSYTTLGGTGQTCMSCHKGRRDNVTYVVGSSVNAYWGPHYSTQSDVLFGQNAAKFDETPFISGNHKFIANACVDCHMAATPDTGSVNRSKVGGHSFNIVNKDNGYAHLTGCVSCHGPVNSLADFIASSDYDGDGTVEPIQAEVDGLMQRLRIALPPVGLDSISVTQITALNDLTIRKAYFNYRLIYGDASHGMHNAKFTVNVLTKSILAIGGIIPVELTSFEAVQNNDMVTLKWETATETNNKGFEIEKNTGNGWSKIGYIAGKGTSTELNRYTYSDDLSNMDAAAISYRLRQVDLDGTAHYSKVVNVDFTPSPKEFALNQNYPNPFNPTTTISFTVPKQDRVKVVIYDAMGSIVNEIMNDVVPAGKHQITWNGVDGNGSKVASGIYFYRLESSTTTLTKKMILMK